jgi:hypothetical protein
MAEQIKPAHKPIKTYYETLAALGKQKVKGEQNLRGAFQALGTRRAKVTVTADKPATANFTFTRPQKKP